MSEITNNTTNQNENAATPVAANATDEMPIKLHVLNSKAVENDKVVGYDQQDIALMQLPNPEFDSSIDVSLTNRRYINFLIDTGDTYATKNDKVGIVAQAHLDELKDMGVDKIDYIYITHFHTDHVGGLETFCESGSGIDVTGATIFLPEDPPAVFTSSTVSNCRAIVYDCAIRNQMNIVIPGKEKQTPSIDAEGNVTYVTTADTTHTFSLEKFPQLELDFKNCSTAKYYLQYDNTIEIDENDKVDYNTVNDTDSNAHNNSSLCCIMTYGKTRIGFFGDISNKAQEHLYHNEEIGHLDLMSVEHHGKNGGFYRPFYDAIAPKMCFTQDGGGWTDDETGLILAKKSKTQAYLQENGIPNYAVSVNGAMTFDIHKSGIATKNKAVKYAHGVKGITSYMGAINNSNSDPRTCTRLATLLKNMEHGTFLSTLIKQNDNCLYNFWDDLVAPFVSSNVSAAELIIYKGGSSYENQSAEPGSNAGYIILIPHYSSEVKGNIMGYWYATDTDNYSNIRVVLKQSSVDEIVDKVYTTADQTNHYPLYNSYPMF